MTPRICTLSLAACLLFVPAAHADDEPDAADIWQETQIIGLYLFDTRLNPFDIEVVVRDGKAYLAGTLPSADEKALAERLARTVPGVDGVENAIVLNQRIPHNRARYNPDRSGSDSNITAMVRAELLWNRLTHAHDISVSTDDGVVTVSGTVPDPEVEREIIRIVEGNRWVEGVDNRLQVSAPADGHN